MAEAQDTNDVRSFVRERYGKIAEEFKPSGGAASCCGPSDSGCCSGDTSGFVRLYETPEAATLPEEVSGLSLGCGDPITLASLTPGQTVLDLGSGGGIDCFLAARQVGPQGHVIGVDMTPAMLEKARASQAKMGIENVEFRLGEIEHLPVADESVDVIISNCVINLSPDKPQVFREAYRALKPGGKLAVSDIVTDGPLPPEIKSSLSAWAGCVAGALEVRDYVGAMEAAGFVDVSVAPVYFEQQVVEEAVAQVGESVDLSAIPSETLQKAVFSAKVSARKA
jgi:SAM-dependent methyltransferase